MTLLWPIIFARRIHDTCRALGPTRLEDGYAIRAHVHVFRKHCLVKVCYRHNITHFLVDAAEGRDALRARRIGGHGSK